MLSSLLSGCKKTDSKEFKPSLDKNLTANLEIEGFFDNFEALDQVVNAFNEYYPNVSVSYERVSGSKLREFMENNKGVDIFMTSSQNFNQEDNEKLIEESYQDEGIISLSTKSKIADVCNQYANGNFNSAKEALEALSKKIEEAK